MVDLLGMRLIEIFEAIPRCPAADRRCVSFGPQPVPDDGVIGLIELDGRRAVHPRRVPASCATRTSCRPPSRRACRCAAIIFRHMLPNGIAPVLVDASFGVAVGDPAREHAELPRPRPGADEPSWGQLLNQARSGGAGFNWWIADVPRPGDLPDRLRVQPDRRSPARRAGPEAAEARLDADWHRRSQRTESTACANGNRCSKSRTSTSRSTPSAARSGPCATSSFSHLPRPDRRPRRRESGCGKSVTALSILRLIPSPPGKVLGGQVMFEGRDLLKLSEQRDARRPRQGHRDDLPGADDRR